MLDIDVLNAVGKRLRAAEHEQGALVRHLEDRVGSESHTELSEAADAAEAAHIAAKAALVAATDTERGLGGQVDAEESRLAPLRAARAQVIANRQRLAVADGRLPELRAEQTRIERELDAETGHRDCASGRERLIAHRTEVEAIRDALRVAELAATRRRAIVDELATIADRRAQIAGLCTREIPETAPVADLRERVSNLIADHRTLSARRDELTATVHGWPKKASARCVCANPRP